MEEQLAAMQRRLEEVRADMDRLAAQARDELEAVHRSYRKELITLSRPGEVIVVTKQRAPERRVAVTNDRPSDDSAETPDARAAETPAGAGTPPRSSGGRRAVVRQPSRAHDHGHLQRLRQAYLPRLHGLFGGRYQVRGMCPHAPVLQVTIKSSRLLWAIAAGLWAGTAVGFAYYYILGAVNFFFFFFFVAAGIGYLVGEAVKRATGHYRGKATAIVAAASTIWAFVLPPLVSGLISLGASWNVVVFALTGRRIINWVVMAFSAYLAWSRNR